MKSTTFDKMLSWMLSIPFPLPFA